MEWVIAILGIIVGPGLTLLGIIIKEKNDLKKQKLNREDNIVAKCQEQHNNDIKEVRKEFIDKLDTLSNKIDKVADTQKNNAMSINSLRASVEKHNNLIERTYKLEGRMDAFEALNGIKKRA